MQLNLIAAVGIECRYPAGAFDPHVEVELGRVGAVKHIDNIRSSSLCVCLKYTLPVA